MFGRVVTAISTTMVAIFLMLAVPFVQLRLPSEKPDCCCPDPDSCKCHDHDVKDPTDADTLRSCGSKAPSGVVSSPLPAFDSAPEVAIAAPVFGAVAIVDAHPEPHASPPPSWPDAPS